MLRSILKLSRGARASSTSSLAPALDNVDVVDGNVGDGNPLVSDGSFVCFVNGSALCSCATAAPAVVVVCGGGGGGGGAVDGLAMWVGGSGGACVGLTMGGLLATGTPLWGGGTDDDDFLEEVTILAVAVRVPPEFKEVMDVLEMVRRLLVEVLVAAAEDRLVGCSPLPMLPGLESLGTCWFGSWPEEDLLRLLLDTVESDLLMELLVFWRILAKMLPPCGFDACPEQEEEHSDPDRGFSLKGWPPPLLVGSGEAATPG